MQRSPNLQTSPRLRVVGDILWAAGLSFRASFGSSFLLLVASLSRGARTILEAYLVKLILDALVAASRGLAPDWRMALIFGGVATTLRLFESTSSTYIQWPSSERLRQYFEQRVLDRLAGLGAAQMDDRQTQDLLKKVRDNLWASSNVLSGTATLVETGANVLISVAVLAGYAPLFVAAAALMALPRLLLLRRRVVADFEVYGRTAELHRKRTQWLDYLMSTVTQMELRMLGALPLLRRRFREAGREILERRLRARSRFLLGDLALQLVVLGLLWWFLVHLVVEVTAGRLTVGDFQYYFRIAGSFFTGIAGMMAAVGSLESVAIHVGDLRRLLSGETHAEAIPQGKPVRSEVPAIELEDVSFRYPGREGWALRHVDLRIEPGERIAIVGENGAGKTTLLKLLMGFYPPTEGRVLIDGIDIRELDLASWHRCLGLLLQDFGRFTANSLAENVAWSDTGRLDDREGVARALRQAAFEQDAHALPSGFDTILSQRFTGGAELSGGQWQKVAMARMFFRPAPVVVLDEPTSAIDPISEARILDHLYEALRGRTVIVVSHRHNTIRAAQRILVMKGGAIIEEGTDEGLLARGGEYARSVREGLRTKRL